MKPKSSALFCCLPPPPPPQRKGTEHGGLGCSGGARSPTPTLGRPQRPRLTIAGWFVTAGLSGDGLLRSKETRKKLSPRAVMGQVGWRSAMQRIRHPKPFCRGGSHTNEE